MNRNDDQIGRILAGEEEIVPSSGFATLVMEAVRREASVPPPIPFPWRRGWPVVALAGAVVLLVPIAAAIAMLRLASAPTSAVPVDATPLWTQLPAWMSNPAAAWATGSLLLALISVKFSMRLASR